MGNKTEQIFMTGRPLERLEQTPRQYRQVITQILSLHPLSWRGCSVDRKDYINVLAAAGSSNPEEALLDIMVRIHKRQDRLKRLEQNRIARERKRRSDRARFFKSPGWKIAKSLVQLRDNGSCTECARPASKIYHAISWRKHPELALELYNIKTLCSTCAQDHDVRNTPLKIEEVNNG